MAIYAIPIRDVNYRLAGRRPQAIAIPVAYATRVPVAGNGIAIADGRPMKNEKWKIKNKK